MATDGFTPGRYLAHVLWGSLLFSALAILAALLGLLIQWIDSWAGDRALTQVLTIVKYGILTIDVVMLMAVLISAAIHFISSGFRRRRHK